MRLTSIAFVALIALVVSAGVTVADRLPNQTPENQVFTIDTVVDATGAVDSGSDMAWLIASPGAIPTGTLGTHWDPFPDFHIYTYPVGNTIADSVFKIPF